MKFVLAPDKFKGSLTGLEFCEAVEEGIRKVFPTAVIIKKPLADGGDGTMEVVKDYLNAHEIKVKVKDPLFRDIEATYLFSKRRKIAFIEMSEASGHRLLQHAELNCMDASSLGTGQLIADALDKGVHEIVLGIGGSATNDGGMGMAHALGYRFLDHSGYPINPIGRNLEKVKRIEANTLHEGLSHAKVRVACDVDNPFYGPNGAAYVYGPQKGATTEEVVFLDKGLRAFSTAIKNHFGLDVQRMHGAGAAGGLGGGAMAFLNASLISGIGFIKEIADFDAVIRDANWIITGEGKLDSQTLSGKTIAGVLESATRQRTDVAAICGIIDLSISEQETLGITYATSILRNFQNLEEAMGSSYENLVIATFNFCKILKKDMSLY